MTRRPANAQRRRRMRGNPNMTSEPLLKVVIVLSTVLLSACGGVTVDEVAALLDV